MTHWIVVDLGYGDAGKGTVVDWLCARGPEPVHAVVRFNGGAQAAHNVVTPDGRHHTFAQFGSGTFTAGVRTHLSRFMLVDPLALSAEARHLAEVGVPDALDRLTADADALLTTPYHRAAGRAREIARGTARHGSCGMGIGETMAYALAQPGALAQYGSFGRSGSLARPDSLTQHGPFAQYGSSALPGPAAQSGPPGQSGSFGHPGSLARSGPLTQHDPFAQYGAPAQSGPLVQSGPLTRPGSLTQPGRLVHPDSLALPGHPAQSGPPGQSGSLGHPGSLARSGPLTQHDPLAQYGSPVHPGSLALPGSLAQRGPLAQPGSLTQSGPLAQPGPLAQAGPLAHPGEAPRVADCLSPARLRRRLAVLRDHYHDLYADAGEAVPDVDDCVAAFTAFAARVRVVGGEHLTALLRSGPVVFEGAQGVLLDEWHGFHPYTTWSTTTFANAETLLAEAGAHGGAQGGARRLAVVRAYMTRHGPGPFVTEDPALTAGLPDAHNGPGRWQGAFRVGHLDLVALRYALSVCGGADELAVTHLDVARARHDLLACHAYRIGPDLIHHLPTYPPGDLAVQESLTRRLLAADPVYHPMTDPVDELRSATGLPITLRSHGPTRADKTPAPPLQADAGR